METSNTTETDLGNCNTKTINNLQLKVYFILQPSDPTPLLKEAGGRNFEIGSDVKYVKEFCLLLAHLVFVKHPGITGLRRLTVSPFNWILQINYQSGECTRDLPTGKSYGGIISIESTSSQISVIS